MERDGCVIISRTGVYIYNSQSFSCKGILSVEIRKSEHRIVEQLYFTRAILQNLYKLQLQNNDYEINNNNKRKEC